MLSFPKADDQLNSVINERQRLELFKLASKDIRKKAKEKDGEIVDSTSS